MDKEQARAIVKSTFENPFDKNRFTGFIKNMLNSIDEASFSYKGNLIPDAYEQHVSLLERIGKYTDGEHKIDILIVKLKKETSIERARTMQRNFIARYLNGSRGGELKDAALVAFVSPDNEDWRFSLVKMDYRFEEGKDGRVKVKEEFTPARRWSFLVGANENSHTAKSRLVPIIADDDHNPTLEELEEAFNIEKATKEFFGKYRDLFLWTKEELDNVVSKSSKVKADFEAKGVNTVDFSKKLLGQIVFLYFLQKKGWFGVKRDADWGTGPKNFLRELFKGIHGDYQNFFNDILEPLFYEALARERDDDFYSRFNCKIPFLNGGLFDPINNYDWVHTDILLPNELFSNKKYDGDEGDGILDVFDLYNFTVKEDEPLEKEVAIDPELLGKAYEKFNAIRPDNYEEYKEVLKSKKKGEEHKFNRQYGVYYTPREIVHYMCQQSLINYLATELDGKVRREAVEFLILKGEQYIEYLKTAKQKNENKENYKGDYKETAYFLQLKECAQNIDDSLSNIKVCDPAVGSGAFPVGMMTEIVKSRLFFFQTKCLADCYKNKQGDEVKRNAYNYKRDCIENSLYGVDIDPGAVEIAKLRLWLSLVVDEEDIEQIKPLPNLDYKIVCGNSLLGVERRLENDRYFVELERLKPLLFNETNPKKKQEYKNQIDDLISQITNGHKEFDFEVYFSEVFHKKAGEKGGFDVVIGNPPYGSDLSQREKEILDQKFQRYTSSTKNSAIYFIYSAETILHKKAINTFIVPKSMCYSFGWSQCADFLLSYLEKLIDAGKAFEYVKLEQVIFIKNLNSENLTFITGFYDGERICELGQVNKLLYRKHNVLLAGQTRRELQLIEKIVSNFNERFGNYVAIERGLNWQNKVRENKGKTPVYRGAQLSKYFVARATDFIDLSKFRREEYSYLLKPKVLNQLAIAHIQNPYPHFYLQATVDLEDRIVFETISCTFSKNPKIDLEFILALNNSKIFAWLLYKFIYSNAIRSTRYDEQYVGRVPCPKLELVDQQPFISIVDRILAITKDEDYLQNPEKQAKVKALEREIDQLVYKLYGLTEDEIRIVEGEAK